MPAQTKKCRKQFCETVFLPKRDKMEGDYLKKLKKTNPSHYKSIKNLYLKNCSDIFCQPKCKDKSKWLKSFSKKRIDALMKQGAMSGCRDLPKEFKEYRNMGL
jgi:hypothetical protein